MGRAFCKLDSLPRICLLVDSRAQVWLVFNFWFNRSSAETRVKSLDEGVQLTVFDEVDHEPDCFLRSSQFSQRDFFFPFV
jgi:hypothetical protein